MTEIKSGILADEIVLAVKDVCNHDINFINPKGIIFASTDKNRVGDYHEIGKQAAATGKTIEVEPSDNFSGSKPGVNIPFIFHGEVIAVIGISGIPDEVRKFAYLAQRISGIILRENELERIEQIQKTQLNQLIRAIIHKEHINQEYLESMLKKEKISDCVEYNTIVVKIDTKYNPENISLIENAVYSCFEQTGSRLFISNLSNEFVILLESIKIKNYIGLFTRLANRYEPIVKVGIGNSYPILKQYRSYKNARLAINCMMGDESLAIYDDLNLEILLGNISEEAGSLFVKRNLSALDEEDRSLLKIYFGSNMSLKETSEKLYIHKNTLQYKLDKIARLTGCNPRIFTEANVLYMALKLEQLSYVAR